MFIDEVKVTVKAGNGGDGCMSFRREKFVPRGGPDGGDGGDGGGVILRTDASISTLVDLRYTPHIEGGRGTHGKGKTLTGARGKEAVIRVPLGTLVRGEDKEIVVDLVAEGQEHVLVKGGRGGRGNARFKGPTVQAPRRADPGRPGRQRTVYLELKLLADVGLVGFPNAGKSTLLSRLSAARPKIADYPFTTLQPFLGIVRWSDYESFVMADLPGLIEGAHAGKGLGSRFLRHIERTRTLLFTLDCTSENPTEELALLRAELGQFSPALLDKPCAVLFSKSDLLGPEPEFDDPFEGQEMRRFLISAVSGKGLPELVTYLGKSVKASRQQTGPDEI
jgi:GTP-binding protein